MSEMNGVDCLNASCCGMSENPEVASLRGNQLIRQPYTAPRLIALEPTTVEGGDVSHVPEGSGGLWSS